HRRPLRTRRREAGDPGRPRRSQAGVRLERAHRGRRPRDRTEPAQNMGAAMTLRIPRRQYADLYGPTVGDRIRLADTDLLIRIERDLTTPGEEATFGGGKVLRDGMGQSARATRASGTLDVVITNAVIVDHSGI